MNQRIVYPTDDGGVAVIIPAPECGLSLQEIAAKDVPPIVVYGPEQTVVSSSPRPWKIVDAADIPADRTFRDAWTADFTEVTE
jgi:hypothetical protein